MNPSETKKIIFICVGNSCRSPMAEAFARHLIQEKKLLFEASSAGTMPAPRIDLKTIQVMEEVGVSLEGIHPKPIDLERLFDYQFIINMGQGVKETTPLLILRSAPNWNIRDPVGRDINIFRQARDIIQQKIIDFFHTLNL